MYLSPGLAPPTYTPPPSPRSYPQRHRGAARRSLSLSLSFLPLTHSFHSSAYLLFPSFFFLSLLVQTSPRLSPSRTYTQQRCVTPTHRSLHAAFTFPCVLTRVYFSPHSSPFSSTPTCAWRRFTVAFIGHQTHTNDAASKPRRIVASCRVAPRRVASHRVAPVLRALTDFSISILFSRIRRNITARC